MRISKNKFVAVTYDLNVGEDNERELMERATRENPLKFIFGTGMMLKDFEDNLSGLAGGDTFDFSLTPEQAYGERNEDHVMELPKHIFEIDGKFDSEHIKEGETVPMMSSDGNRMNGSVLEGLPSLQESREYLAAQLVTLPWEGLALSRDEPALATRFIGF